MGVYETNMEFLKKNAIGLYDALTNEKPLFNVELEKTDDPENFMLKSNGISCFMHSGYNKEREMENMCKYVKDDTQLLIVFGLGFGDILGYITENYKNVKEVVIIEPCLQIFDQIIRTKDFNMLGMLKVTVFLNKNVESLMEDLKGKIKNKIKVDMVYHLYFRTLFKDYYESITKSLISYIKNSVIEIGTVRYHMYDWLYNAIKSLKNKYIQMEDVLSGLDGFSVIIVSAGPSLNKNMHLLKEVKDRALIIAVGSAVRILHNNGIIPHLRMAVDGAEHEKTAVIEGVDTEAAPIIFTDSLYAGLLDEYKGPKIKIVADISLISRYINIKCGFNFKIIKGGFSVSNLALNMLCVMKFKKIILMGQDLCYTDEKIYANGAWQNSKVNIKTKGFIETEDIYGNTVYTMPVYVGIKSQIEETILQCKDTEFINATEGGLKIENAVNKNFSDVLAEFDSNANVKEILDKKIKELQNNEDNSKKIYLTVLEMEKDLDKIIKINNDRIKMIKKLKKQKERGLGVARLIKEHEYMNVYENKLSEVLLFREVISYAIEKIFTSIRMSAWYDGDDVEKQLESIEKIRLGNSFEIFQYCNLMKVLISEYKVEVADKIPKDEQDVKL